MLQIPENDKILLQLIAKNGSHNENAEFRFSITPRSCPDEMDISRPSSGSFEDLSWHVQNLCNNAAKRICTKIL